MAFTEMLYSFRTTIKKGMFFPSFCDARFNRKPETCESCSFYFSQKMLLPTWTWSNLFLDS